LNTAATLNLEEQSEEQVRLIAARKRAAAAARRAAQKATAEAKEADYIATQAAARVMQQAILQRENGGEGDKKSLNVGASIYSSNEMGIGGYYRSSPENNNSTNLSSPVQMPVGFGVELGLAAAAAAGVTNLPKAQNSLYSTTTSPLQN